MRGKQPRLRARARLARRAAAGRPRSARSQSSPGATSRATLRPTSATSRSGRGCRCATRAPVSERSPTRCVERDGLLELKRARRSGSPRACLLDQWDPLLVGWRSRDSLLDRYPRRDSPEAHFRPFAYVRARAVATWSLRERRRHDRRAVRAGDARRRRGNRGRRRRRRALPVQREVRFPAPQHAGRHHFASRAPLRTWASCSIVIPALPAERRTRPSASRALSGVTTVAPVELRSGRAARAGAILPPGQEPSFSSCLRRRCSASTSGVRSA